MLEVKNLTKIYSGKGGVSVKALDDVSVVFPETGMVFLLGKSGSGKSTLLNVAGGLDKPDGGEIIVKGKSSKDFSGSDFDSYRNTFIGFVFQEYNILNEFTIEQNIALALQLQSKPNDKAAVAALLEQVDLAGYGKRKPNTLSGGQKQRVAIARALIKEPEIIMADEPTGALDSNTGKQVLDTLKKLSETKLVIVVSHDREFAEYYGDRIIELKDGKIISDVSKVYNSPSTLSGQAVESTQEENVAKISDNTIAIKDAEALTDEELKKIGQMLRGQKGEVIITADQKDLPGVKRACRINENGSKESFKDTEFIETKEYDGSQTKFIKSRLPLGHAIKMGASGLKSKPIRLIFTILLAVAAFILFGVVSTFMLYDPNYSVSEAMKEANYPAATIAKKYTTKITSYRVDDDGNREFDFDYDNETSTRFGASEIASRNKNGLDFAGIFTFTDYTYSNFDVSDIKLVNGSSYVTPTISQNEQDYYVFLGPAGFSDCGAEYMTRQNFTLIAGAYPTSATEVALPSYLAELFVGGDDGYSAVNDLVGKKVRFSLSAVSDDVFTITGVYNVGVIPEKYVALKEGPGSPNRVNEKEKVPLQNSLKDYLVNGFHLVVFVTPEFYENYKDRISTNGSYSSYVQQEQYKDICFNDWEITWDVDTGNQQYSVYTEKTRKIYGAEKFRFYDFSDNAITFNENQQGAYISKQRYNDIKRSVLDEYWWRISYRTKYVKGADDAYNDDVFQNKLSNSKDNGYSVKRAFIDAWQSQIINRLLTYKMAQQLVWSGEAQYTSGPFYEAYQVIENYCYNNNVDADLPTDAMWAAVTDTVNAGFSESQKYGYLMTFLRDEFGFGTIFEGEDDYSISESLKNEALTGQEYDRIKTALNAFMVSKGYADMNAEHPFALLNNALSVSNKRLYYVDKNNNKGSIPILGYFEIPGTDWPSEYFISEAFMNSHASAVPYAGGYQIQVAESSYVVPADAKYNYLVTLTNNSMEQITALRATEKDTEITIKSSVYEELQMFLELIEELEKIFLYVGLGVGVLAAFFLLNFISVSISAKKKDIGILRAVGARGSDVFKIFYAEALIIAFICFVLACVGSFVVCFFLNRSISEVLSMQLLNFGPINIALVFGISIFVSVIATFFPVYFAARKSPVEAIRAL